MLAFEMSWSWSNLAAQMAVLYVLWTVGNWLFSPLSCIPGPLVASFTRLWHVFFILRGDQNIELTNLHEKHGQYPITVIIVANKLI